MLSLLLNTLLDDFIKLRNILIAEQNDTWLYAINRTIADISSAIEDTSSAEYFIESARDTYYSIQAGARGFAEFFIGREDFEEMILLNAKFNQLKEKINSDFFTILAFFKKGVPMKGDFEQAVNNNEISAYFKGEGDYFTPEERYKASHSYIMNFMGMMFYLEKRVNPYQELVKYFRLYLSSLKEDALDAWSLFRNINCFYFLRKNNRYFLTQNEDLIDELTAEEKKKIGVLCRYVRDNFDKVPGSAQMFPIEKQMKMEIKYGCPYNLLTF